MIADKVKGTRKDTRLEVKGERRKATKLGGKEGGKLGKEWKLKAQSRRSAVSLEDSKGKAMLNKSAR